ncbi:hypothetical protein CAL7716_092290 [Calothrix sp. PCC 7716]|mgnify:CR=1 FL=1|nr:hypothetical protein CAL7716_092290 [Calothrix sp. PCC 7716]
MNSQNTLSEFKDFCKKNILQDLHKAERERKQVLVAVIISSLTFLFFVNFLNQIFFINVSDSESYISFYIGNFSISLSTFLPTRLFFLLIYLILFLGLFIIWSLFYNASFESFSSNLERQVNKKIFEFINSHQTLNLSTKPFDTDIDGTLSYIQHSQMFDGLFKPNSIKQYNHISGYVNNIIINITQVDIQSGLNHRWTEIFDITKDISYASSKNVTSLEEIIALLNVVLFFIPTTLLLLLRLIKGFPYVLKRIAQGKNIDYQRFEVEILKNQVFNYNIFKGLLFRAKFNKFAKSITVIQPNTLKVNVHSINHGDKQLIKLEDSEFAKYFTVYSEDQVDARYILSTNLMEKLVGFREKANKNIYASFVDDMIYFAIEYPDGLFEANLYRSMLSFAPLREYFEAIQLMLGLVEELNLDRQIWKSDDM